MYTQSNFANGNEYNFSRSEETNRRESFPTTAREHPVFSPSDLRPRHLNAARSALFLVALTLPCARNPLRSWLRGSRSPKVSRSHSLLISFLRFVPFPAICFVVAIFCVSNWLDRFGVLLLLASIQACGNWGLSAVGLIYLSGWRWNHDIEG